ncbi:MAG TPA: class I SAM-dependent methyltransferase [Candidatus Acidoferrales bacterium]|nr:class I SAM-dependent methyltransferase [Candidatus Acidoferrales bacterium]
MPVQANPLTIAWRPVRRLLRPVWYGVFRYHPYHYLGALFWAGMGPEARRTFIDGFSRPLPTVGFRLACLREYWVNRYFAGYADSAVTPPPILDHIWGAEGATDYHQENLRYFSQHPEEFDQIHAHLLARIAELLSEAEFECVVEVGCGSGLLLERVAARAEPSRAQFIGLDLDPRIIALNRQRQPGPRVQYRQAPSVQEFLGRMQPSSALVFANATFTFFTEKELQSCFAWLATHVPRGAIVIADATALDLEREQHSRPYGVLTFSHNYGFLLADAGLERVRCELPPAPSPHIKKIVASATWGMK